MNLELRDDDVCVNCGHERLEHRNDRCYAEEWDGRECQCDDPVYDDDA